jgi:hypothetical protein
LRPFFLLKATSCSSRSESIIIRSIDRKRSTAPVAFKVANTAACGADATTLNKEDKLGFAFIWLTIVGSFKTASITCTIPLLASMSAGYFSTTI